jgi:hypothetical protein
MKQRHREINKEEQEATEASFANIRKASETFISYVEKRLVKKWCALIGRLASNGARIVAAIIDSIVEKTRWAASAVQNAVRQIEIV